MAAVHDFLSMDCMLGCFLSLIPKICKLCHTHGWQSFHFQKLPGTIKLNIFYDISDQLYIDFIFAKCLLIIFSLFFIRCFLYGDVFILIFTPYFLSYILNLDALGRFYHYE